MSIDKILADAPKKATHVDINNHYFHNSTAFYWLCCDDGSTCVADIGNGVRKLEDLREIQHLRAENEVLRNLCKQCADYLDINDLTNISHGSIYHKELRKASEEKSE